MSNRGIAPEVVRTLLCLFRRSLGEKTQAATASLHDSQWSELGQLAKTYGVAPWILLNLSSASIKAIPESLVSAWKTWERQNRLRVLANWSVTIRVLRLLDSAGIRASDQGGGAFTAAVWQPVVTASGGC